MSAIGIFDSGLGGLTVYRALRRSLPTEDLIYLGDTARVPYGSKSGETIVRYSRQIASFLLKRDIKYLVVACNTASAHAMPTLRAEVPVPAMGVVEPGAAMAAERSRRGKVGVIGTLATVSSGAYHRALLALSPEMAVFGQPCPLLVPLVEEGWLHHPVTSQVAQHYLTELRMQSGDLDTIVLGCTHYPLLKETLSAVAETVFGHPVELIDSAQAVSQAVQQDMLQRGMHTPPAGTVGSDRFFFTDVNRFADVARRFLGQNTAQPELADL